MELIINLDDIKDPSGRKFLLETLKFLGVQFKTAEKRQTSEEYNKELEEADADIDAGNFTTMGNLLKEIEKW